MPDHIRLLGDEVEASKWVGYARSRGNGSLTSPSPGVVVRANKVGSMNLLTISAEGGLYVWVMGFSPGVIDYTNAFSFYFDKSSIRHRRESYLGTQNTSSMRYFFMWGDSALSGLGTTQVGIAPYEYLILANYLTGPYVDLRYFATTSGGLGELIYTFFVGDVGFGDASGDARLLVTAATVVKGIVYMIGYLQTPAYFYPAPLVFAGIDADAASVNFSGYVPPKPDFLYQVAGADDTARATFLSAHTSGNAIGAGPKFFAMYEWGVNNILRVIDYYTGKLIHSWAPTNAQADILKHMVYPDGSVMQLAVSSKYIAVATNEVDSSGIVSSSHFFVWEVTPTKITLINDVQIAKILNPRGVGFDMRAAFEGIL